MAHECFEDDYIAGLMNKHFVCVKVDREERPDGISLYGSRSDDFSSRLATECVLPAGRASVLWRDLSFSGGSWAWDHPRPQLLMRIVRLRARAGGELIENAEAIQKNIPANARSTGALECAMGSAALATAAQGICGNHDDQFGVWSRSNSRPR